MIWHHVNLQGRRYNRYRVVSLRVPFAPGRFAQGQFVKLGNYIIKSYLFCYVMLGHVRLENPGRTGIGAKRFRCERDSGRNDPKPYNRGGGKANYGRERIIS